MSIATISVPAAKLEAAVAAKLREAGASEESLAACVRALMHASRLGVDSHGVRLVIHYCRMLRGGRIHATPTLKVERTAAASALVDGDDGLGHYAAYRAMEVAGELAAESGVGAVGVKRSTHLGAAGAYALAGAEAGYFAFATTNADPLVALFDGAKAFHGTNPLAFGAPVPGQRPWLFDMATSSMPKNKVFLYGSLGKMLPPGVAADAEGRPVTDPAAVKMMLPLGGTDFGYKGAGLAGVATLLSAAMTGAELDANLLAMFGSTDVTTRRNVGAFALAIDPAKFVGVDAFGRAIAMYLDQIRSAPPREGGGGVMAPGDREWAEAARRDAEGIPIDPDTAAFLGLG